MDDKKFQDLKIETHADVQPLRKLLGLTVADLAKIAFVSPRTVEGWEQGRNISPASLELIRKYLMCNYECRARVDHPKEKPKPRDPERYFKPIQCV